MMNLAQDNRLTGTEVNSRIISQMVGQAQTCGQSAYYYVRCPNHRFEHLLVAKNYGKCFPTLFSPYTRVRFESWDSFCGATDVQCNSTCRARLEVSVARENMWPCQLFRDWQFAQLVLPGLCSDHARIRVLEAGILGRSFVSASDGLRADELHNLTALRLPKSQFEDLFTERLCHFNNSHPVLWPHSRID